MIPVNLIPGSLTPEECMGKEFSYYGYMGAGMKDWFFLVIGFKYLFASSSHKFKAVNSIILFYFNGLCFLCQEEKVWVQNFERQPTIKICFKTNRFLK
jgi:hypothetical protein